jgi:hypothetical protein
MDWYGRRSVPLLCSLLALAACSSNPPVLAVATTAPDRAASSNAPPTRASYDYDVALARPDRSMVLDRSAPGALSVAVSQALFVRSPLVVVADRAGAPAAAARSAALGVPLLLLDDEVAPIKAEMGRLGARHALALGGTEDALRKAGVALTDNPPTPSKPQGLGYVAVLVRSDSDPLIHAGATAAAATARAAGAFVVGVRGGDPRGDRAAIAGLTRARPHRVIAAGPGFGSDQTMTARAKIAGTGVQLPGGGQLLFPGRRLVALYGHPGTPALGVLGEQGVDAAIQRARAVAAPYDKLSDVPVVPAFEIIATVASGGAGPDGNYSAESTVDQLRPWVDKATRAGMYVVLDLQPGRTSFLTQAKAYAPLLVLPNVGLALDPEWRLLPNQVHLKQIGSVASAEINQVSDFLAQLTAAHHLPQKLLVLHQFRTSMIRGESALNVRHDEVAVLIHMDGQGAQGAKSDTWAAVQRAAPAGVVFGWKNFYDEDKPILTPAQTMAKRPAPVMISYQ